MARCRFCCLNDISREEFYDSFNHYDRYDKPRSLLDIANIPIYINEGEMFGVYFDGDEFIEQDSIEIDNCPVCGRVL